MFTLPLTPSISAPSGPTTATTPSSQQSSAVAPPPPPTAEKTHGIALDEPSVAHQAILFILDHLIRNNQAMPIARLYDSFGDRSFSAQMLRAVGGNEQGLTQFLLRYPSLFTVVNDTVSANSGTPVKPLTNGKQNSVRPKSSSSPSAASDEAGSTSGGAGGNGGDGTASPGGSTEPVWDAKTMREIEQEALAFFRKQLSKREEEWLPIVSVAGHASQASADVRKFVGPQNEFKVFLARYPHVFVLRDDYCGLKGKADLPGVLFPPPSPPPKRRVTLANNTLMNGTNSLMLTRSTSFKSSSRPTFGGGLLGNGSVPSTPTSATSLLSRSASSSQRLTPGEVKAVHYVMRLLHKSGRVPLQNVPGLIARAPDYLAQLIGFTRDDLVAFFKRHNAIFQLHPDGAVTVKPDAVRALLVNTNNNKEAAPPPPVTPVSSTAVPSISSPTTHPVFTTTAVVLRIFPKYGILNMDNNEQVFFDIQSCQFETYNDLTCVLNIGDIIHFTGVLGPKEGSTKWKSLKTWTPASRPYVSTSSSYLPTPTQHLVHSASTNNISSIGFPSFDPQSLLHSSQNNGNSESAFDPDLHAYHMAAETNGPDEENQATSSLSLVNSSNRLSRNMGSVLPPLDEHPPLPKMVAGVDAELLRRNLQQVVQRTNTISLREDKGGCVSEGCQTTSTGEILATNIHIE